jgi:hypothetical protein
LVKNARLERKSLDKLVVGLHTQDMNHGANILPLVTDRSARRDSRLVCGGARALTNLKVKAHRADRRVARVALRLSGVDYVATTRRVTGYDVALFLDKLVCPGYN